MWCLVLDNIWWRLFIFQQALAASDKKATPKDEPKETKETSSMIPEVVEEISQNGVAEVASACWMQQQATYFTLGGFLSVFSHQICSHSFLRSFE